MNKILTLLAGVTALGLSTGCTITSVYDPHDGEYGAYDEYYVDAYVDIPLEVRALISDHVEEYSMPPVARYGYTIYPVDLNDPYNLPSYVSSDFNGDYIDDYAYMFSSLSWDDDWYLKTKLLIVLSTSCGYVLSSEIDLGTATGCSDIPVEEYWGIRLLERGTHVVTFYDGGLEKKERVDLDNDAIYLTSIDPEERSVLYAFGTNVGEITMDMGVVAKKQAQSAEARSNRIVKLGGSTLRTPQMRS